MSDTGDFDTTEDPFSPENIGVVHFIQLGRIYDVLMALLTETNAEAAKSLLEMHATGALVGGQPFFNGKFVSDEVNNGTDA